MVWRVAAPRRSEMKYRRATDADRPRVERDLRGQSGWYDRLPHHVQDLTDIRSSERDARLQQRLAVGEMAAGIAHEIRNPLASMSGSIQILRDELPLSAEQEQLMDIVLRRSDRLNGTIRSFLDYARPRFAIARFGCVVPGRRTLLLRSADLLDSHVVRWCRCRTNPSGSKPMKDR